MDGSALDALATAQACAVRNGGALWLVTTSRTIDRLLKAAGVQLPVARNVLEAQFAAEASGR